MCQQSPNVAEDVERCIYFPECYAGILSLRCTTVSSSTVSKEEISTFLFGLDDFLIKVWTHELWHKLNKGRKQSTK